MSPWELWGLLVQHVGNVLSVVLILAILSGRKEARATLGWVLLVLFLPYFGAVAYLVFGRRMPLRLTADRESDTCCILPPEGLAEPMDRTAKLTARSPVRCTRLELLPGAEEKYRRLEADIGAAGQRVLLSYYVFRRDGAGRRLLEAMARKAEQGVETRLLFDGWGAFGLELPGFLGPYRRRGVQARAFHPVANPLKMSRINFRNHRKIAVIDGTIGYTGSINVGEEYLGRHPRFGPWKDLHVRVEGEAAGALEQVFRDDWAMATGEELTPSPAPPVAGDIWAQVISSGPNQRHDSLFPLLFAQFAAARDRLDLLTPYLVPDYGLVAALRIAARQGVRVRVMVPGRSNHPMVAAAGRSYYDELLDGGVEIYETREGMLHAKAVLVDGRWALVGSANLDNRSFHLNFELNLATSDETFCAALEGLVEDWLADSVPVTQQELGTRSLPRRLLEGACRTLSPVL